MTLTSSNSASPFSVNTPMSFFSSNAIPNIFRCPIVYTGEFGNGLSDGMVPSLLIRSIFPTNISLFCEYIEDLASPIEMYNLSSGPMASAPPA